MDIVERQPVSNRKSWIWAYARAMKTSVAKVGPADLQISMAGDVLHVSCTLTDAYEAEAVREMIRIIAGPMLSSRREMVRGDIYPDKTPEPTYSERLAAMFGASTSDAALTPPLPLVGE